MQINGWFIDVYADANGSDIGRDPENMCDFFSNYAQN